MMLSEGPAFATVAASCRQAYTGAVRPVVVLERLFAHAAKHHPMVIRFLYEDGRVEQRLSDEDLREIHLHLTDAYPEEVADEPDLIQVLADLSTAKETAVALGFIMASMRSLYAADNNRTRAIIIDSLLRRVSRRDVYWLIIRLTRRRNPFKRGHFVRALANHHEMPIGRIRREAMFTRLDRVAEMLSTGAEMVGVPTIGSPLIIPMPRKSLDLGSQAYGADVEVLRGERMTIHKSDSLTTIMDVNGVEVESIDGYESLLPLLPVGGIFLIERVPQDDFPLSVVDVLRSPDGVHEKDFVTRRTWLFDTLPHSMVKDMTLIENEKQALAAIPANAVAFLHFHNGHLGYASGADEVVRFTTKSEGLVFRVICGIWTEDPARGLSLSRWRIAARDGPDGYYEVGDLEAEREVEKRLIRMTVDGKATAGEQVMMKGPTFVDVQVIHADFDERGLVVGGTIQGIVPNGGISDVAGVEEVEWRAGVTA